jgi:hypothetical protein
MNKTEEQVEKLISLKPQKPALSEFGIGEHDIKTLNEFREKAIKDSKGYIFLFFFISAILSAAIILDSRVNYWYIIFTTAGCAIMAYGLFPPIIKLVLNKSFSDLIFDKTKTSEIDSFDQKNKSFESAMSDYKERNSIFERAIGRATNHYWLSLNPKAFEEAVAELFADDGWDVYITPETRDQGVDLFIEKDGVKAVVQCKTYKKVIGPNVARDLYGTMIANNASHAYLAAPGGFSHGTKSFCHGKPITLLGIDELSKMFYPFENYMPHWIDSARSMEDIKKGIRKNIYRGSLNYNRKRYY